MVSRKPDATVRAFRDPIELRKLPRALRGLCWRLPLGLSQWLARLTFTAITRCCDRRASTLRCGAHCDTRRNDCLSRRGRSCGSKSRLPSHLESLSICALGILSESGDISAKMIHEHLLWQRL